MKTYGQLIRVIENLYDKAQSAVLFNNSTGVWFRTTVGVRQGCLLSLTFLERIMCEALDDRNGSVSIGGRRIAKFHSADDIVVNAEEVAGGLVDRLDTATKTETGHGKTKVMTSNPNGFQRQIKIKGQKLEALEHLEYLGSSISNEGSKPKILSRIAQTAGRLKIIMEGQHLACFQC